MAETWVTYSPHFAQWKWGVQNDDAAGRKRLHFVAVEPIASKQERTGLPSRCTVQAPHCAMPQPNFVPVVLSTSRNTQSSGMSPSTLTLRLSPSTLMTKAMASSPSLSMAFGREHELKIDAETGERGGNIAEIRALIASWASLFQPADKLIYFRGNRVGIGGVCRDDLPTADG